MHKLNVLIFVTLFPLIVMADAVIFSGNDVKSLKYNLDLFGRSKVMGLNADPTSGGGQAAPLGSIGMNYLTGNVYVKSSAPDTGWQKIQTSGSGGTSTTIANPSGGSATQDDGVSYNFTANSETHTIFVYAYKDSGNNRVYSATPLQIDLVADSSLNQHRILWSWSATAGATGYKIHKTLEANVVVNKWLTVATNSFTDDQYNFYWTASNSVVTPSSPTPFYSATALSIADHGEVLGNLTVGLALTADSATLEEKLVLGSGASRTEINKNGPSSIGKAPIANSNFHIYNPNTVNAAPNIDSTLSLESALGDTELTLFAGDTTAHGPGYSAAINFVDGTQAWQMSTNLIDVGNNWNWQDSTTSNIPLTLESVTGFVGINITDPAFQLDVDGNTNILGNLTFSGTLDTGLSTAGPVLTDASGVISSEAQLAMSRGGTNKNMTASGGAVAYSDADSLELSAVGTSGQLLKSNGSAAPTWVDAVSVNSDLTMGLLDTLAISTTALRQTWRVQGNSTAITMSSTDPFGSTDPVNGARITLIGNSDTNTVTLTSSDAANGLVFNGDPDGTTITLEKYSIAEFEYNSTLDRYILISFR